MNYRKELVLNIRTLIKSKYVLYLFVLVIMGLTIIASNYVYNNWGMIGLFVLVSIIVLVERVFFALNQNPGKLGK